MWKVELWRRRVPWRDLGSEVLFEISKNIVVIVTILVY